MYVCLKCYVIGIDCCSSYYDLHVSVAGTGELYEMFALQRAHGMGPFLDMGQVDTLWAFAWRCINCGEVVDAVIRNHRLCRSHLAVAHEKTDRATISPLSTLQQTRPSRTCHTYAAGLNAVTIVWIAERFTEGHRAAFDWLNERTDEKINLFGLEIELWRIASSPIAPKFNIISQPNDWSRTVKQAAVGGDEISEHKQLQLRFWTAFREYIESKGSFVRCQKPLPQHWTNHAIGRSGVHLTSILSIWNSETNTKGPEIRAELYMDGPNANQDFAALEKQKDTIERP